VNRSEKIVDLLIAKLYEQN